MNEATKTVADLGRAETVRPASAIDSAKGIQHQVDVVEFFESDVERYREEEE
jgi:hypothetical protein